MQNAREIFSIFTVDAQACKLLRVRFTQYTQARVIHSNSPEWVHMQQSVQAIKEAAETEDNDIGVQTCEDLIEALRLSRCMLIMGYSALLLLF